MGQFLHIGFVAQATTQLNDTVSKDDLLRAINDSYAPDVYDVCEVDGEITLSLNSAIVREELVPFVRQVYEDYFEPSEIARLQKTVDFISGIVDKSDWLERVLKKDSYDFYPLQDDLVDARIVSGKEVWLWTIVIQLGSEGKFLMEEYRRTLRFFEACAQKAYADFKLGKSLRVFVY